jgi:hypothetical protein
MMGLLVEINEGTYGLQQLEPDDYLELRNRFAMAALTGLVVSSESSNIRVLAEAAYQLADAMLDEHSNKFEEMRSQKFGPRT